MINITLKGKAKDIAKLLKAISDNYPRTTVGTYLFVQQIKKEVEYKTNKKGGLYHK